MPAARPIPRGFDVAAAQAHLAKRDRRLATWMRRIGPIERDFAQPFQPVDALAHAILYQQLSGKAAATIVGRVLALMPRRRIDADGIAAQSDEALRGAGVSRNKIAALRDLAAKAQQGVVPDARGLARMSDADAIGQLTQVRGIGRWTVEMLLMSRLGRPDILPVDDLGIRKGAQVVHGWDAPPKPQALAEFGERWGPYRTLASFYLWRVVEAAQQAAPTRCSQD
ncbi:MAG: DNA-3-methyladenine glycosylase 2 family protein [Mizugakiibacter sp.]|uniref:DNA-3-methyladenine glycosylase family protein n=1 Tax=Mizugakiibacter sp. TaxID=1972610 RepID=UPI0031C9249B|nr:DNA-3-methyladenine glycosylase 2 family protein [Xanthomonadaceae bacterium]